MNHTGVVAGMFGGFVTTVVWVVWFKEKALDLYEMIPGLLVGLLLAFAGSRIGGASRTDNQ